MLRITWSDGRWLPSYLKAGAFGMVNGVPVYAGGMTQPWRETECAWHYDSERGDWLPVDPMPVGRCYTTCATADDGLLVVGGRKSASGAFGNTLGDAWLLFRTDASWNWRHLPDMNQPRAEAALAVAGNVAVCAGGGSWETVHGGAFTSSSVTTAEMIDLADPSSGWIDLGEPPFSPRSGMKAAAAGGSIWFTGGYDCWVDENKARCFAYYDDVYRFDPVTREWEKKTPLPVGLSGHDAVSYADRYIILIGGCVRIPVCGQQVMYAGFTKDDRGLLVGQYSDLVWVYDTLTDTIELLEERCPHALNDLRACIDGETLYLAGGENADVTLSNTSNAFTIGTIETV
jgi:N-acetylneuraminic acid mutarotase